MLEDIEILNSINNVKDLFNTGLPVQELPAPAQKLFKDAYRSLQKQEMAKASEKFAQVMRFKQDHIPTLEAIGTIAFNLGNDEVAANFFKAITELAPFYATGYGKLASVYALSNKGMEAIPILKRALDIEPNNVKNIILLAYCYTASGNQEDAKKQYKAAMAMAPDLAHPYYLYIKNFHTFKDLKDDSLYKKLKQFEKKLPKLSIRDQQEINASIAKAHEDIKDFDTAFSYFEKAAAIRKANIAHDYDINHYKAIAEYVTNIFNKERIERYKSEGLKSDRPVFIAGMPRSGTTLIEQILHAHPDIYGIGEVDHMEQILKKNYYIENFNYKIFCGTLKPGSPSITPEDLGKEYLGMATKPPESKAAKRLINKSISNVFWLGVIATAMPGAKIIHISRNPLDCCLSCYTRQFSGDKQPYTNDLEELGIYYRIYRDLMDHWKTVIPDMILDVVYEEVVNDFENQARRIIDFLDLPWDQQCLRYYESKKFVSTASITQVRQPIYKTSQNKWKNHDKHLIPLIKTLGDYAPEDALHILEKI